MRTRKILGLATLTVLLFVLAAVILFRQDISDYWRLRGYTPSAEVVRLADNTTLYDDSRKLFYIYRPLLTDKDSFNTYCRDKKSEFTIVLGCYIDRRGIYLLDVEDPRLNGVEEVTAAHELLHAAYARLSGSERERIDALLLQTYADMDNQRIRDTVEQYRKQDSSVVNNELHSILATELRELPAELEEYYSRYFSDRLKVVGYSEQYEQAFIERRNMIRSYDEQLASLKVQIEQLQASLEQTSQELKVQRERMNSLRSSGQTDAYNAEVPAYNAKVNRYNRDIDRLTSLIVQYNDIVQKRNEVATEEAELVEAIDSRTAVPQQQ